MYRSKMLIFAVIQFIVLTLLAMAFFPGGSFHDHMATGYLFTKNFFSDLGSTETFRGESNLPAFCLFTIALGFVGAAMISYSFFLKKIFPSLITRVVAIGSLILSGKSFIAVAALPLNIYPDEHAFFVKTGFVFLLFYVICLLVLQLKNHEKKLFVSLNIIYLLALSAYIYILFFGPSSKTPFGLSFRVITQKFIVYFSMINLGLQTWNIYRGFRSKNLTQN